MGVVDTFEQYELKYCAKNNRKKRLLFIKQAIWRLSMTWPWYKTRHVRAYESWFCQLYTLVECKYLHIQYGLSMTYWGYIYFLMVHNVCTKLWLRQSCFSSSLHWARTFNYIYLIDFHDGFSLWDHMESKGYSDWML